MLELLSIIFPKYAYLLGLCLHTVQHSVDSIFTLEKCSLLDEVMTTSLLCHCN